MEFFEKGDQVLGGDAQALVGDGYNDIFRADFTAHDDQSSVGRILNGVVQDVAEHLADPTRVGLHDGELG